MTTLFTKLIAFGKTAWFIPVVWALAVYSLTRLIVEDSIIDRQRAWFHDRFPYEGHTTSNRPKRGTWQVISQGKYFVTKGTWLGELSHCPWCTGFWVAAAVTLTLLLWPVWTTLVLFPLALRVIPGMIGK